MKRKIFRGILITILLLMSGSLLAQDASRDLIMTLEHKDWRSRKSAAQLIGAYKIKSAVKPLIDILGDEHPEVRQAARNSLVRITKQNFPPEYDSWIDWWDQEGSKQFGGIGLIDSDTGESLFIISISLLLLLFLFIMVFSYIGGSKIKTIKELIKRAEEYLYKTDEINKKFDKVTEELDQNRTELVSFFKRLKDENQTEIERFSDLLQENVEHRLREATMNMREKAETELKETLNQLKGNIDHEIRRLGTEQSERFNTEIDERKEKFLNEVEAHTLFIEASFHLVNARYQEALRIYKKLLSLNPEHYTAWSRCGTALRHLTRYDEALESYEKALLLAPDNPKILYNIAATYALMRKKSKMIEHLTRAFQFDGELKDEALNDSAFKQYWTDSAFKDIAEA